MIVDPDFLDHWRTGMVADAINDPMAAIYILRLWGHCQDRKSDTFVMPTAGLKAQCKCPAPAEVFERALIEAGFLKRDGDTITVLGWAEKNASLLAAWENGSKGGRPKKNPAETHGKPTGNPTETHGQPIANPGETDKSREEEIREKEDSQGRVGRTDDEPRPMSQDWTPSPAFPFYAKSHALSAGEDKSDCLGPFVAYYHARREIEKTPPQWDELFARWVAKERKAPRQARAGPPLSKQSALEARNAATAARILENLNAAQRTPEVP